VNSSKGEIEIGTRPVCSASTAPERPVDLALNAEASHADVAQRVIIQAQEVLASAPALLPFRNAPEGGYRNPRKAHP
jgi:hypothetical protein